MPKTRVLKRGPLHVKLCSKSTVTFSQLVSYYMYFNPSIKYCLDFVRPNKSII